jgi:predicted TIM-barrel fold metal-dependent hydrolase
VIIDAHAHLGFDTVYDHLFTAGSLLESQALDGIDITLVQPATVHDADSVRRYHDAIADLCEQYRGRFRGIANPNPHLPGGAYEREVARCVDELHFVGVKLHPAAHAVNPTGRDGRKVFALSAERALPVMVHTGAGIPWAAPALLEPLAAEYPDLPIIVAHAGAMILAAEAFQLAQRHPNVYLECSWTPGFVVAKWAEELGAARLMFGSDHAENAASEFAKLRTAGLSEEALEGVLGRTAATVFRLREKRGGR